MSRMGAIARAIPCEISDHDNYGQMLDMVSVTEDRLKLITKYS